MRIILKIPNKLAKKTKPLTKHQKECRWCRNFKEFMDSIALANSFHE
jgi:hypothetical protein